MTNVLHWFNKHVIEERNSDFEGLIKMYIKGILPNIPKTGNSDIDDEYK